MHGLSGMKKTNGGVGSSSSLSSMTLRLSGGIQPLKSSEWGRKCFLLPLFFLESSSFLISFSFSRIGVEVLPPKKLRISAGILAAYLSFVTVACRRLDKCRELDDGVNATLGSDANRAKWEFGE